MRAFTNGNNVIAIEFKWKLTIAINFQIRCVVFGKTHWDFTITINDQWTWRQCMWEHWNQGNGIHLWHQNRSSGGKRISCRAGWCGDNQAIGTLWKGEFIININMKIDHVGNLGRMDYRFINCAATGNNSAFTFDLNF